MNRAVRPQNERTGREDHLSGLALDHVRKHQARLRTGDSERIAREILVLGRMAATEEGACQVTAVVRGARQQQRLQRARMHGPVIMVWKLRSMSSRLCFQNSQGNHRPAAAADSGMQGRVAGQTVFLQQPEQGEGRKRKAGEAGG